MKKVVAFALCAGVAMLMAGTVSAKGDKGGEGGKKHKGPNMKECFEQADANKDGKLSLDEFKTFCNNSPKAEAKFKAADADNDGFVTQDELKAAKGKGKKGGKCAKPEAPAAPAAQE